ncbi:hypothetical protein I3842_09G006800 [Carya illinoinensis]|uniref:Uncharacterized protein n=1 Tax=Carya illinoinensis TaxID=32201 RepID=A0A922DZ42_CARIL|nr:hypothetical protein I3842_09G006800 [Carya illinoinensis]
MCADVPQAITNISLPHPSLLPYALTPPPSKFSALEAPSISVPHPSPSISGTTRMLNRINRSKTVVENLVCNTRLLESTIQEARSKKDTLKARAQSAKTANKVSEMLGNVNTSNALSAFEKMEEKVLAMESQAEALGQLTTDDLEGKFALLEGSSVDDDLVNLKKELSGSSKLCLILPLEPPLGRTVTTSANKAYPYRDADIEMELNKLRQRAKDF